MIVKHKFISLKAEQSDPTLVGPNEWNDTHTVTGVGPQPFTGAVDGSNTVFTVNAALTTFMLFKNGVLQASDVDYTSSVVGSVTTITFITQWPPQPGDILQIWGM